MFVCSAVSSVSMLAYHELILRRLNGIQARLVQRFMLALRCFKLDARLHFVRLWLLQR